MTKWLLLSSVQYVLINLFQFTLLYLYSSSPFSSLLSLSFLTYIHSTHFSIAKASSQLSVGAQSRTGSDSDSGSVITKVTSELDESLEKASVKLEKAGSTISELFGEMHVWMICVTLSFFPDSLCISRSPYLYSYFHIFLYISFKHSARSSLVRLGCEWIMWLFPGI